MKTLKKASYIIFALCVLHWPSTLVDCAITGSDTSSSSSGSSKAAYARTVDKGQESSSSVLGSIYHKSRQSRCVTCYEDRRYSDDRSRYYGSYAARSGDDRTSSWYYPSYDRYDDRGYRGTEHDRYGVDRYGADRYGADRYGADRYGSADRYAGSRDDRYAVRPSYDRYDTRTRGGAYDRPLGYERGESRGYGYDNRDRYYSDYYGRDRYYDRPKYSGTGTSSYGGYERDYYDRYSPRYDYRPYRPWDDTYSKSSGPYYYGKQQQEDRHYLPEPYDSYSPCGTRRPNCPYSPQGEGVRVTSGTIDSGYNMGVSHTTYNTNSNPNRNESSKGYGSGSSASGGWSYMREDEQSPPRGGSSNSNGSSSDSNNNNNRNRDRDRSRDQQSSAYGALLDRGSNLIGVEPAKADENANNSNQQQANDESSSSTDKQNGNEQNS